ncbi:MAG: gamma-glutamyl-gamma-aminobutyrate hydrolase family protein, partial [Firmicutes bacterium]|nr:gamma-glutamyl-gamma-aminobutyrate hydrolase family protein [Bacillota bacterium]
QKMLIEKGSRLEKYLGEECIANTFHEQAVGQLAEGLRVTARAEDGTIEAFEHESLPIIGVQWNPEHSCEGYQADPAVFRMFIDMVREGK